MIELGGNIVLSGFESKDFTELIVVKKIVGQYARLLSDTSGSVEKLSVSLDVKDAKHTIAVEAVVNGEIYASSSSMENLYMALDTGLKDIVVKLS